MAMYIPSDPDPYGLVRLGETLGAVARQYGEQKRQQRDAPTLLRALEESKDEMGYFDPLKFYQTAHGKVNPQSLADFAAPLSLAYNASKDKRAQVTALAKAQSAPAKQPDFNSVSGLSKQQKLYVPIEKSHIVDAEEARFREDPENYKMSPDYLNVAKEAISSHGNVGLQNKIAEKVAVKEQVQEIEQDHKFYNSSMNRIQRALEFQANLAPEASRLLGNADGSAVASISTGINNLLRDSKFWQTFTPANRKALATLMKETYSALIPTFGSRPSIVEFQNFKDIYPTESDTPQQARAKLQALAFLSEIALEDQAFFERQYALEDKIPRNLQSKYNDYLKRKGNRENSRAKIFSRKLSDAGVRGTGRAALRDIANRTLS